jgi:hypothetical protein
MVHPALRYVQDNLADRTRWRKSVGVCTQIGACALGMPFGATKKWFHNLSASFLHWSQQYFKTGCCCSGSEH